MLLLLLLLICYTETARVLLLLLIRYTKTARVSLTPTVHCKNRHGRSASALRFLAAVLRHSETAVVHRHSVMGVPDFCSALALKNSNGRSAQALGHLAAVHWHSETAVVHRHSVMLQCTGTQKRP